MIVVTVILFTLPCWVLWLAWQKAGVVGGEGSHFKWRSSLAKAAVVVAACATLLELIFFFSWFHNGGSPHGLTPPSGVWKVVGRPAGILLVVGVILSIFGKGRFRWLIPVWGASLLFVAYMLFALEMD